MPYGYVLPSVRQHFTVVSQRVRATKYLISEAESSSAPFRYSFAIDFQVCLNRANVEGSMREDAGTYPRAKRKGQEEKAMSNTVSRGCDNWARYPYLESRELAYRSRCTGALSAPLYHGTRVIQFVGSVYVTAFARRSFYSSSSLSTAVVIFRTPVKCPGGGKWEIREKTRRPAAPSGMIPTCENPGVAQAGIETRFSLAGCEQCSATVALKVRRLQKKKKKRRMSGYFAALLRVWLRSMEAGEPDGEGDGVMADRERERRQDSAQSYQKAKSEARERLRRSVTVCMNKPGACIVLSYFACRKLDLPAVPTWPRGAVRQLGLNPARATHDGNIFFACVGPFRELSSGFFFLHCYRLFTVNRLRRPYPPRAMMEVSVADSMQACVAAGVHWYGRFTRPTSRQPVLVVYVLVAEIVALRVYSTGVTKILFLESETGNSDLNVFKFEVKAKTIKAKHFQYVQDEHCLPCVYGINATGDYAVNKTNCGRRPPINRSCRCQMKTTALDAYLCDGKYRVTSYSMETSIPASMHVWIAAEGRRPTFNIDNSEARIQLDNQPCLGLVGKLQDAPRTGPQEPSGPSSYLCSLPAEQASRNPVDSFRQPIDGYLWQEPLAVPTNQNGLPTHVDSLGLRPYDSGADEQEKNFWAMAYDPINASHSWTVGCLRRSLLAECGNRARYRGLTSGDSEATAGEVCSVNFAWGDRRMCKMSQTLQSAKQNAALPLFAPPLLGAAGEAVPSSASRDPLILHARRSGSDLELESASLQPGGCRLTKLNHGCRLLTGSRTLDALAAPPLPEPLTVLLAGTPPTASSLDLVAPSTLLTHVALDDAAGRRVFSGISRFPPPFIPVLLHSHLASPSSSLKTSVLRVDQLSSLTRSYGQRFRTHRQSGKLEHMEQWRNARAGEQENPEKTRRPAASSDAIPTCEYLGEPTGNRTQFALVRASCLDTTPPRPLSLRKLSGEWQASVYQCGPLYLSPSCIVLLVKASAKARACLFLNLHRRRKEKENVKENDSAGIEVPDRLVDCNIAGVVNSCMSGPGGVFTSSDKQKVEKWRTLPVSNDPAVDDEASHTYVYEPPRDVPKAILFR
ncbi:hypothetical protein PR048_022844 [Dryococelus australis]|uniref:Uncharacterized protein n=1 Tax=Dryococelus australis TaxID=614101 RepID=A0ABQ9GSE6_9NEOP|nr:hypothetical protein PR048_022844 [Dryococelus australis]